MPFWRCYYHLVWTTKNREPLITPKIEPLLFTTISAKCTELDCHLLAVNAVPDHIHTAVNMPPKLSIARWMKVIKGASSYEINSLNPDAESRFRWQEGYGALTFGAKNLAFVVAYINAQKEHHAANTIESYLEQTDESE